MAKRENYKIVNKEIYVKMTNKLSAKELTVINNYVSLGYKMVIWEKEKKKANENWTAATIQKWLKENGTKEQQAKYWELFNAVVMKEGKPVLYETGEKKGEPKVKGHIATLSWFKDTFPSYPEKE